MLGFGGEAMEGSSSNKKRVKGEASPEGDDSCNARMQKNKKITVTMEMKLLHCAACSRPLRPPIFQCSLGHFFCYVCKTKLPECNVCLRDTSQRCLAMDRVVKGVFVSCKHGCTEKITYYQKEGHEVKCPDGPCFCPESGCGFAGPKAALANHFTSHHKWPSTSIKYNCVSRIPFKSGTSHLLLSEGGDRHVFLLTVAMPESLGYAVYVVCVQPGMPKHKFGCSVSLPWPNPDDQFTWSGSIKHSSLWDGIPKGYFCVLPDAVDEEDELEVMITKMLVHDDNDELEPEDTDESSSQKEAEEDEDEEDANDTDESSSQKEAEEDEDEEDANEDEEDANEDEEDANEDEEDDNEDEEHDDEDEEDDAFD